MEEYSINLNIRLIPEEKTTIKVAQVSGERVLTYEEIARCLAGGIALIIKMVNTESENRDHILMKEIVDYLNSEFVSNISFADVKAL